MGLVKRLGAWRLRQRTRHAVSWSLGVGSAIFACIIVSGVIGYMTIEGWGFIDSFYMVVITLSTVGFMEVQPLSKAGRIMTAAMILGGVGSFAYLMGTMSQVIIEGRLQHIWGKRRVSKLIKGLRDHFIICGYGRIGSVVVEEIEKAGHPMVVIEKDPEALMALENRGVLVVSGDATMDEVLLSAGLERARCLITALSQDAANVFVTLTARQLNPGLTIVARTDTESHISRLERAGADRVVMPYNIGGLRMAQSVLRPTVTNLLDLAGRGDIDLQMEELPVAPDSELVGKLVRDSGIRANFDVIIVCIKSTDGKMLFNPGPGIEIKAGDLLVALGKPENMPGLQAVCSPGRDLASDNTKREIET
ncbi:potassium channel family protein [Pseudodesulfovibrio pelocollis]|uniref:potassium channel family protein n=1 Tax=Pseudodesulfovibrio pelocollis TaxID=3051432 RepID=UPI00255AE102|nr:potassium channel protein [Pseudodesulfovibrio sp. SB368]